MSWESWRSASLWERLDGRTALGGEHPERRSRTARVHFPGSVLSDLGLRAQRLGRLVEEPRVMQSEAAREEQRETEADDRRPSS